MLALSVSLTMNFIILASLLLSSLALTRETRHETRDGNTQTRYCPLADIITDLVDCLLKPYIYNSTYDAYNSTYLQDDDARRCLKMVKECGKDEECCKNCICCIKTHDMSCVGKCERMNFEADLRD